MAQMLLINPKKRARRRPAKRKTAVARRRVRRSNPITVLSAPRRRRARRAAVGAYRKVRRVMRRRRNPISTGGSSIMAMLKSAVVGGAGAITMDLAMGQINKFLPASMAKVPGKVGVYEVAKVAATIALGKLLSKPTRGLSQKMAQGSLIVQAHQLMAAVVPTGTMPLGYYSPAAVANMSQRVGPNGVRGYTRPGASPLLSAYTTPGASPLLNRGPAAAQREGVRFR